MMTIVLSLFVVLFSGAMLWIYYGFVEWLMTR